MGVLPTQPSYSLHLKIVFHISHRTNKICIFQITAVVSLTWVVFVDLLLPYFVSTITALVFFNFAVFVSKTQCLIKNIKQSFPTIGLLQVKVNFPSFIYIL